MKKEFTWNHRVIRYTNANGDVYYEIHEVYYKPDGKIDSWTVDEISPLGETLEELRRELERMLRCLDNPVLVESGDTLVEIGSAPNCVEVTVRATNA